MERNWQVCTPGSKSRTLLESPCWELNLSDICGMMQLMNVSLRMESEIRSRLVPTWPSLQVTHSRLFFSTWCSFYLWLWWQGRRGFCWPWCLCEGKAWESVKKEEWRADVRKTVGFPFVFDVWHEMGVWVGGYCQFGDDDGRESENWSWVWTCEKRKRRSEWQSRSSLLTDNDQLVYSTPCSSRRVLYKRDFSLMKNHRSQLSLLKISTKDNGTPEEKGGVEEWIGDEGEATNARQTVTLTRKWNNLGYSWLISVGKWEIQKSLIILWKLHKWIGRRKVLCEWVSGVSALCVTLGRVSRAIRNNFWRTMQEIIRMSQWILCGKLLLISPGMKKFQTLIWSGRKIFGLGGSGWEMRFLRGIKRSIWFHLIGLWRPSPCLSPNLFFSLPLWSNWLTTKGRNENLEEESRG